MQTELRADRGSLPLTDVVFDFCGVLIDRQVTETLAGAYTPEEIADYFAYDDRSGFHYYDELLDRGASIDELCARYAAERGPRLAAMFRCYYDHIADGLVRWVPGMYELLLDVRAAGVRLWGLTNWGADSWPAAYERFPELARLLSGVVVSGREGVSKPDARIYRCALERFGLDPARALFFDDNAINVTAARAAGLPACAFIDAAHARAELAARGVALAAPAPGSATEACAAATSRRFAGCGADGVARLAAGAGAAPASNADARHLAESAAVPVSDQLPHEPVGRADVGTELLVHDGASVCETAEEHPGASHLTPLNASADGSRDDGVWHAVPLGALILPDAPDPARGVCAPDFWLARASEYNALQWHRIDWQLVRRELARAAAQLQRHPEAEPEFELAFATIRERTFLEMWFGYGDPCCEAYATSDGRFRIGYGQHRLCPVANWPLAPAHARLLKLAGGAFTPGAPALAPDTLLPLLVRA